MGCITNHACQREDQINKSAENEYVVENNVSFPNAFA